MCSSCRTLLLAKSATRSTWYSSLGRPPVSPLNSPVPRQSSTSAWGCIALVLRHRTDGSALSICSRSSLRWKRTIRTAGSSPRFPAGPAPPTDGRGGEKARSSRPLRETCGRPSGTPVRGDCFARGRQPSPSRRCGGGSRPPGSHFRDGCWSGRTHGQGPRRGRGTPGSP